MPFNVLNWGVTTTLLSRDDFPRLNRNERNRYAVVAGLLPGTAGLLVPFVAARAHRNDRLSQRAGALEEGMGFASQWEEMRPEPAEAGQEDLWGRSIRPRAAQSNEDVPQEAEEIPRAG